MEWLLPSPQAHNKPHQGGYDDKAGECDETPSNNVDDTRKFPALTPWKVSGEV